MTFEAMQVSRNSIGFIECTQMNVLTKITKDNAKPNAPSYLRFMDRRRNKARDWGSNTHWSFGFFSSQEGLMTLKN